MSQSQRRLLLLLLLLLLLFWHHSPWKPFASSLAASEQNILLWDGVVAHAQPPTWKTSLSVFFLSEP